jgi:hypothetical protein
MFVEEFQAEWSWDLVVKSHRAKIQPLRAGMVRVFQEISKEENAPANVARPRR